MPAFSYRAVGRDGKSVQGTIEADALDAASRALRAKGLTPLNVESGARIVDSERPPSRQEILSMTSELSTLLRAGLSLDRALKVLIDMDGQPRMRAVISEVLKSVKGGKALSIALQPFEASFGTFYLSMVRAGEASGQLSSVLDRLVEHLESAKTTRDSVISALIYPAILLVVAVISIVVMLGFVVPQFETLFADMGDALPPMTKAVVGAAEFIKAWGFALLIVIAIAGVLFQRWAKSPEGKAALDRRLLSLPVAGGIAFEYEMAKFARTVGTLLGNGVSLLKAIQIAIDTVGSVPLKEALQVLPPAVKSGRRMSVALEETEMFTPMVIQMTRVGEESGSLDGMMLELAKVFEEHVASGIKRLLTLLEPVLILTMGFIIALIIISILMGILSVNDLAL
ncbi:type II secretion system protein [Luminiphilus syltensis NOR5-1B]|uniref:Type II secretion system protein n=1 Tax=Luminiphilus syltensis NOR5-1B TaxID=565045 RepID=B8KWY2_9GAMM|nr:type II secretion system F family protein [Luminiphilus syltensis]EED36705.1 type II secretion system protein [Luminiphilus syltensis NOR5-1B]